MKTLTPQLSQVTSDEYKLWKAETLAKQVGQIEPSQKTGVWHQHKFLSESLDNKREKDTFVIELAPGYRQTSYKNAI